MLNSTKQTIFDKLSKSVLYGLLMVLLWWGPQRQVSAQPPDDQVDLTTGIDPLSPQPDDDDDAILAGEKFDILLSRSFLLGNELSDTVHISPTGSGNLFVGLGFNFYLTRYVSIRLEPGLSFYRIAFQQFGEKKFPTAGDSLYNTEKLRANYVELPIGLGFNITRRKGRTELYAEIGGSVGYLFSSDTKTELKSNQAVTTLPNIPNIQPWRATAFLKLFYRFIGFSITYRLTNIFTAGSSYFINDNNRGTYPGIPHWELGLCIKL